MEGFSTAARGSTIIILLKYDQLKATAFDVENGILRLWHNGERVLSHAVELDPGSPPHFWTNETDGPRVLAWFSDVDIERHGIRTRDRPRYSFNAKESYEKFQSTIRNATFIADFTADSIKPSGKGLHLYDSHNCDVKLWASGLDNALSITLPFMGPSHQIINEVLQCSWLNFRKGERSRAHIMHITFKSTNPRDRSDSKHKRALSFGSTKSSTLSKLKQSMPFSKTSSWSSNKRTGGDAEMLSDQSSSELSTGVDIAPTEVLHKFSEIVITFMDNKECLNFHEAVTSRLLLVPDHGGSSAPISPISDNASRRGSPLTPPAVFSPPDLGETPTTELSTAPATRSEYHATPQMPIPPLHPKLPSPDISSQSPTIDTAQAGRGLGITASDILHRPRTITSASSFSTRQVSGGQTTSREDPTKHSASMSRTASSPGASGEQMGVNGLAVPGSRARTPVRDLSPYKPPGSPSLSAQQREDERIRYWQPQTEVAPIARSARMRAQANKEFYSSPLTKEAEIRLLHIRPGRNTELEVWLERKKLQEAEGTYEALSYSWGPGEEMKGIYLLEGGQRRSNKFSVSLHLYQALKRLRLTDAERVVWIDAMCINQAHVKEMNHQVPLMGEIYKKAKRTIIWIAEFEETKDQPTCIRNFPAADETTGSRTLCARNDGTALEHGDLNTELKTMLQNFHTRLQQTGSGDAWYLRLWCVQEFYFSDKMPLVYLGRHAIGWDHFAALFEDEIGTYGPIQLFRSLSKDNRLPDASKTLHELCSTTGAFKVSDPRDRIYSLLNMTKTEVTPDYAKSILEVLEEVTNFLIKESHSVDVLLDKRYDRSFGDGFGPGVLPSYMPDFTQLQTLDMSAGRDKYHTGGENSSPDFELCDDDEPPTTFPDNINLKVLNIKAIKFDKIQYVTTVDDIPAHETSPSGALTYNSLQAPGTLVKQILEALHYDFEPRKHWELDRSPKIGRLILEFLFEETRNHLEELRRCTVRPGMSLKALYNQQTDVDITYVYDEEAGPDEEDIEADVEYIRAYWAKRKTYISTEPKGRLDVIKAMDMPDAPWSAAIQDDVSIRNDFQAAVEFENLYCYARRTRNRYHFCGYEYHQPMRRNVLNAADLEDIRELDTEYGRGEIAPELHEYSDKARQRDFFRTVHGFVGLGPTGMKANDMIVVPYGASRPFILRRCPDSDAHTLVGEAVLPGIMHGQWLPGREKKARYYKLR